MGRVCFCSNLLESSTFWGCSFNLSVGVFWIYFPDYQIQFLRISIMFVTISGCIVNFPSFIRQYLYFFYCYCNFANNLCIFTRTKYFCSLLFERIYNRISLGLFVFYIVYCSLVTVCWETHELLPPGPAQPNLYYRNLTITFPARSNTCIDGQSVTHYWWQ